MKAVRIIITIMMISTFSRAQEIQISKDDAARAAVTWIQSRFEHPEIRVIAVNSAAWRRPSHSFQKINLPRVRLCRTEPYKVSSYKIVRR